MFYIVTSVLIVVACYVGYRLTLHMDKKIDPSEDV